MNKLEFKENNTGLFLRHSIFVKATFEWHLDISKISGNENG